jgi:ElaB/YqjD/DUF883 family membrane-anchored ribosome-binding protein
MPAGFGPAPRIAKGFVPQEEALDRDAGDLNAKEQTFLKAGEEGLEEDIPAEDEGEGEGNGEEYSEDEEEAEDEGEPVEQEEEENAGGEESMDELKSILKDIRSALMKQSNTADVIKADLKKSLAPIVKAETDKMLRKMGLHPTRPDVQQIDVSKSYGIDTTEETTKVQKSADGKTLDMNKVLDDMSKKSWTELGQLREKTEGFSPFNK